MVRVYLPLLLFSLCASSPIADATASSLRSNEAALLCSGHRVSIPLSTRGRWLPLNHRRGPCSPLPSPETESVPSTADDLLLHRDRLRAGTILKGLNGTADVTVPTTLGSSLDTLEYVVTVGLGTPAVAQTVHVDTGSDVAWVQCRPCAACHPQKGAMFDPARSSTYSPLPCASAACKALGRDRLSSSGGGNGCSRKARLCQYAVNYGDGSNTTGTYGEDTLTLAGAPSHAVRDFRFGCSHATQLFGSRADGLLGLGGGSQSLVSQMAQKAFSYCLPPTAAYSGFLTLGVPRAAESRFAVTPMYRSSDVDTYYLVLLQGIIVAGRRLRVPASAFAAGAVMDSGTVITRLPQTAYRALRKAFRKEMSVYPRVAPPSTIFDTCYNLSGAGAVGDDHDRVVPSVALVFERGATVELDRSGIILGNGCLAFASTGDDHSAGIIGNVQQRTLEVLYDIAGGAVGFRRGAC